MKRGRKPRLQIPKSAPVDPLVKAVENAIVEYLESAVSSSTIEDFEVVPNHDRGEPADPFLAVHVAIAPGSGPRRFEVVLAIEAANKRWLPDDEDDILQGLHQLFAIPLNPSAHADDDADNAPFSDFLAAMESQTAFVIRSVHDVKNPTLGNPAASFPRLVYAGVIIPDDQ